MQQSTCICCGQSSGITTMTINNSVTSDSKPWAHPVQLWQCVLCGHWQKYIDDNYLKLTAQIYSDYSTNTLTAGQEMSYGGTNQSRCDAILEHCNDYLPTEVAASILDVGTGSGAMLQAVDRYLNWQLYSQDVYADNQERIAKQLPLAKYYVGELDNIDQQFDVISLIHVLEHIQNPEQFLRQIKKQLKPDGRVIIQVPNISENIWDFGIYDHIAHFTQHSLIYLVQSLFTTVVLPKQLKKEITIIALDDNNLLSTALLEEKSVVKLATWQEYLYELSQLEYPIALFGTGPAAIFAKECLAQPICYWIDENPAKVGQKLLSVPIIGVDEAKINIPILLPYPRRQQEQIKRRYPHLNYLEISKLF